MKAWRKGRGEKGGKDVGRGGGGRWGWKQGRRAEEKTMMMD